MTKKNKNSNLNPMKVRRATAKDIDRILELLVQVNAVHANLRPDLFLRNTKYNHEELEKMMDDERYPIFVCVDESDTVMGYGFCVLEDYSDIDLRTNIKSIYIDDICVDEKYRRMHVGNTVYEHILSFAKENGFYNITLNVWEGNDAALSFYKSLGMGVQKTTLETIIK